MSDSSLPASVANLLRPLSKEVFSRKGKLCLSTVYLHKLNRVINEIIPEDLTSSFHTSETKTSLQVDSQFIRDLVKNTIALKISPDLVEDEEIDIVDLRSFQNVKFLELHKVNVMRVVGIQKLRSHLEELTCTYTLDNLEVILDQCGGDYSYRYNWSELKQVNFSHNNIQEIESSFESTPWLQILDLSHNQIKNLEIVDHLPNLKRLNLSYNKLEKVPRFKGQICKRLQVLLVNNNFIEDISGLSTLHNLLHIDLSQNCLMDHNMLLSISPMPSLCSLDLRNNPINFHPIHRTLSCNYLNKNTSTVNFVLDNTPLNKTEKSLVGSLHPLSLSSLGSNGSSSQNSLDNAGPGRPKKVRYVPIQEGHKVEVTEKYKKSDAFTPSPRSNDRSHLDMKMKIEQLRQEYQEGWLSKASKDILQDILKFPEPSKPSLTSTPVSEKLVPEAKDECERSGNVENPSGSFRSIIESTISKDEISNDTYTTCISKTEDKKNLGEEDEDADDVYSSVQESDPVEIQSDDDDFDDGQIFLGGTKPDSTDLCIVITKTHLSERDSETSKQKARWHMNIVKCCMPGDHPDEVKVEFDTERSDRMARKYYVEESEQFVRLMFERISENKIPEKRVLYRCLKCNYPFSRTRKVSTVMDDEKVSCPKCDSNMVHKDSDL